jgi:pentapeptide repeat protein
MPDPSKSEPESDFVCDCKEWMRKACAGELYRELEGKRYCVLHFPGKEKSADFEQALQRKLENQDFDFSGVWFCDKLPFENFKFRTKANFVSATFSAVAYFNGATFSAEADFNGATFSAAADFSDATFSAAADFSDATFSAAADFGAATFSAEVAFHSATFSSEASFSHATLSPDAYFNCAAFSAAADFLSATFSAKADFDHAAFSGEAYFAFATFSAEADFLFATFSAVAEFRSATFSAAAYFSNATFNAAAYFSTATFADHVRFAGVEKHQKVFTDTSQLDLQFARIEKPDRVSFHTLSLRPHWFVNIDARNFDFTNVNWGRFSINEEISRLEKTLISSPHHLLAIACRNLAVNAEENHRYEEASKFRYMAMEARRLESWRGFAPWRLSWWYWLASGYGERVWQAFFVLLGILLLSALLYTQVGFARWEPKLASESDALVAKPMMLVHR